MLCSDIVEFFKINGIETNNEDIKELLNIFLLDNIYQIIEMINSEEEYVLEHDKFDEKYARAHR